MIEDIARIINVPRICLSVVATSKGLVAGDLSYVDCTGNLIDCSNTKEGMDEFNFRCSLILNIEIYLVSFYLI